MSLSARLKPCPFKTIPLAEDVVCCLTRLGADSQTDGNLSAQTEEGGPMASFEKNGPQERRPGLFIFAVLLLLLAAGGLFVGPHNYLIRSFSVLAVMVSVYFVRSSNFHARPTSPVTSLQEAGPDSTNGPGALSWAVSGALVPMLVVSYLLLRSDALHGGHVGWPADLFGGVAFACAIAWSYLVMKLTSGRS